VGNARAEAGRESNVTTQVLWPSASQSTPRTWAAWSASVAGVALNLIGPCPVCGHDAPNSVPAPGHWTGSHDTSGARVRLRPHCVARANSRTRAARLTFHVGVGAAGASWQRVQLMAGRSLSAPADPILMTAAEALRDAAPRQSGRPSYGGREMGSQGLLPSIGLFRAGRRHHHP